MVSISVFVAFLECLANFFSVGLNNDICTALVAGLRTPGLLSAYASVKGFLYGFLLGLSSVDLCRFDHSAGRKQSKGRLF